MRKTVMVLLIVVGVIHLLPLSGILGPQRLANLYGLAFDEPNLAILMRHRAVLFGLLGIFLIYAALRPAFRPAALIAGFVSVVSFLWIAGSVGGYNPLVARVVYADWIALACLTAAAACHAYSDSVTRRKDQLQ